MLCMHLHLAPAFLPFALRGGRLAVFLHGIECWKPLGPLRRRALLLAWRLVCNSQETRRRFQRSNPVLAGLPLRVCPLGIGSAQEAREGEGTEECKEPGVLLVGRMDPAERYKGHDEVLEAWVEVRARIPTAVLHVVGEGADRPRLEEKARRLGLGGSVRFHGEVADHRLESLYALCSFLALPSAGEGFGLVYLEAMRAGKACIGAQGAAEEIIEDGETGFIVPYGDVPALRERMLELLCDAELRQALGRAGRRRYERHYTEQAFARRLSRALDA
ncbi:MAG: glycosyltransferase family 1 protein [Planctomycetota bacterium]|nr:MAG: glycosyltransferase family 1 protein [Planctomycetota bacterium]